MNLARKHFQKTMAKSQATEQTNQQFRSNMNQYELMMAQLHNDLRSLKSIQSLVKKSAAKKDLIAAYQPYIDGVISADSGQNDDVITTIMLWCIDAGDYDYALNIATYVIKHGLSMSDNFSRNTACVLAEEIADAALKAKDNHPVSLSILSNTWALLNDLDYHDQAKSKLLKALGNANKDADDLELALEFYKQALTLNDRIGVKKDITALEKQIKQRSEIIDKKHDKELEESSS